MMHLIHQLRMVSGSNKKMAILRQHKDNEHWKAVLEAMYDSSINYYISAPQDSTFLDGELLNVPEMLEDLRLLYTRQYTGHAARNFALDCSRRYGEIFRLILGGSLKAGVSITTINKAYPGLIPTFDVMLAKDVPVPSYPILASTKYDGVRILAFVYFNRVELKTRSGKTIQIYSIQDQMSHFAAGVYDGELVSGDGKQAGRTTITGSVNKCLKGTATDIGDCTFCIFDFIPLEAWDRKQCTWTYEQRLVALVGLSSSKILITEQLIVETEEATQAIYENHIDMGYEGLILRYPGDMYEWKRTDALIKKKAINEMVLTCYDVTEGTGKYENMVGSLACTGKVGDKVINVNVGSGLSDYDREQPMDYYIGKAIEVLYNDIVLAKGETVYSLFLPRYKRVVGQIST